MSKRQQASRSKSAKKTEASSGLPGPVASAFSAAGTRLLLVGLLVIVVVGGVVLAQRLSAPVDSPTRAESQSEPVSGTERIVTAPLITRPIGGVTYCRQNPGFLAAVGLPDTINVSTTDTSIKGLVLYDARLAPEQVRLGMPGVYQHPSWDDAGNLGPVAVDGAGNIYTAPSPQISLFDNPPERANVVYKVDSASGVMTPLVDLPWAAPHTKTNPYGILGIAFDCDTDSLYVSTVAGSTFQGEVGRIYRLRAADGQILDQIDNVDAMGLAVYNGATGKRLYFGPARLPEVQSLALDDQGSFGNDRRTDLTLTGAGSQVDLRARRISFPAQSTEMVVRGIEFYYNLVAMSEIPQATFHFVYDPVTDGWTAVK